jgi:hypothetical protein
MFLVWAGPRSHEYLDLLYRHYQVTFNLCRYYCSALQILVLCRPACHRQQRELADIELSRLSAEVEASAAAAADAQGQLAAAAEQAAKHTEAARSAQLKVGGQARAAVYCTAML